jgi:hypothetical protein
MWHRVIIVIYTELTVILLNIASLLIAVSKTLWVLLISFFFSCYFSASRLLMFLFLFFIISFCKCKWLTIYLLLKLLRCSLSQGLNMCLFLLYILCSFINQRCLNEYCIIIVLWFSNCRCENFIIQFRAQTHHDVKNNKCMCAILISNTLPCDGFAA